MVRAWWMFAAGAMGALGLTMCTTNGSMGSGGAGAGAGGSGTGGGNGSGGNGGGTGGGNGGGSPASSSSSGTPASSSSSGSPASTSTGSSSSGGGSGGICSPCNSDSDCAPVADTDAGAHGHCNSFGYCDIPWGTECFAGPSCGPGTCDATMGFCDCTPPSGGWPVQTPPTTSSATPWVGTQLLYNGGTNQISGIWFQSLTHGVITLQGVDPASFNPTSPGAILGMVGPLQTSPKPLVDGKGGAPPPFSGMDLDFDGIITSPYGLVVPTNIKVFAASTDKGKTFPLTASGVMPVGGPSEASWFFVDSKNGYTAVDTTGEIYTSATAPSVNTTWTTGGMAVGGGTTSVYDVIAPRQPQLFQSSDGQTMIAPNYNAALDNVTAGVAVSTNKGQTWTPFTFTKQPSGTCPASPNVIVFANDTMGIAAYADNTGSGCNHPYVYYTKTGGKTAADWTLGTLPSSAIPPQGSDIGDHFNYAFWAADGSPNVWLLGNGLGDGGQTVAPLLYWSSDGGATWTDLSAGLASYNQVTDVNGHKEWLVGFWVGFALDAKHVWLGGYQNDSMAGFNVQPLAYTSTGGM